MRCNRCPPHAADRCDAYLHLKVLAGLVGDGPASKLSTWEQHLVGVLPKAVTDPRAVSLGEFFAGETSYEAAAPRHPVVGRVGRHDVDAERMTRAHNGEGGSKVCNLVCAGGTSSQRHGGSVRGVPSFPQVTRP